MAITKGSEFFATFKGKSQAAREAAAIEMVKSGSFVRWPLVQVPLVSKDGKLAGSIGVLSDYFAIGTADDYLYLPLTPITAQKIADILNLMLPTTKIVRDTWKGAQIQIEPFPMRETFQKQGFNPDLRMTSIEGFNDHNTRVRASLDGMARIPEQLVSGSKKDVVISNKMIPGRVAIYGWFDKSGEVVKFFSPPGKPGSPIQGLNPSDHNDQYADYSHGIRFIQPFVSINGQRAEIGDPAIASLVSDEGPLKNLRYPTGSTPTPQGGFQNASFPGGNGTITPKTGLGFGTLGFLGLLGLGAGAYYWRKK